MAKIEVSDTVYEKSKRDKDPGPVGYRLSCGSPNGSSDGKRKLTECTTINFPSKPLDAVPLLVHAPEVVPPYIKNTRESVLGKKGDEQNDFALQLTTVKEENTSLLVHVWCVVGLGGIFYGGRIRGGRLLRGPAPVFLGFCALLGFLPSFFGYHPFPVNTGAPAN